MFIKINDPSDHTKEKEWESKEWKQGMGIEGISLTLLAHNGRPGGRRRERRGAGGKGKSGGGRELHY